MQFCAQPNLAEFQTKPLAQLAQSLAAGSGDAFASESVRGPYVDEGLWSAMRTYYLRRYGRDLMQEAAQLSRNATIHVLARENTALWHEASRACTVAEQIGDGVSFRRVFEGRKPSVREFVDLLILADLGLLRFSLEGAPYHPFPNEAANLPESNVDTPEPLNQLSTETALEQAKAFVRRGWYGAARYRFEDLLQVYPDHEEAKGYLAWIDFLADKHPSHDEIQAALTKVTESLLACGKNADFHTYRGMLLRLGNRYTEAIECFTKALQLEPAHPLARSEKRLTSLRIGGAEWPELEVESVRVNAKIIVQRRIGRNVRVHSFQRDEIRIGSGLNDDIIVSEVVMPQIAKRHCTVFARAGRFFVRRNASFGRVWLNDTELDIRKDAELGFEDCVRLGEPAAGPVFEFRVFNLAFLHDTEAREVDRIRM